MLRSFVADQLSTSTVPYSTSHKFSRSAAKKHNSEQGEEEADEHWHGKSSETMESQNWEYVRRFQNRILLWQVVTACFVARALASIGFIFLDLAWTRDAHSSYEDMHVIAPFVRLWEAAWRRAALRGLLQLYLQIPWLLDEIQQRRDAIGWLYRLRHPCSIWSMPPT